MLGAATEVPPTSPASSRPPVGLISQTPSLQKNVASWPEAAFKRDRELSDAELRRRWAPDICIWPTIAVAVAVVPPPAPPENAMVGADVQPKP